VCAGTGRGGGPDRSTRARLPRGHGDPLTGAMLTLDQIRAMVDDLFAAHKAYLPEELQV
jgi:hypothetical protein